MPNPKPVKQPSVNKLADTIASVCAQLKHSRQLFMDFPYNTEAFQLWIKINPTFNEAIQTYVKAFFQENLHKNQALQEALRELFSKKDNTDKLVDFLQLQNNRPTLVFLAKNLPALDQAARCWAQQKSAYENYLYNLHKLDSLALQLAVRPNPTNPAFAHFPFCFTLALQESKTRVEQLKQENTVPEQLLNGEILYVRKLQEYKDTDSKIRGFQKNTGIFQGHSVFTRDTPHHEQTLRELMQDLKTLQARQFLLKLEQYIRQHHWQVGFQFKEKHLDHDPSKTKLPTSVAEQLEFIRQAKERKMPYTDALTAIQQVGAAAADKASSFTYNFFAIRSTDTQNYYNLFLPGNENNLHKTLGLPPELNASNRNESCRHHNIPRK